VLEEIIFDYIGALNEGSNSCIPFGQATDRAATTADRGAAVGETPTLFDALPLAVKPR
jgi:hypothetical protein